MKYLCTNCSYVYDEALGDEADNVLPGTKVEEFQYCPVCEEIDTFHHINEEINYIEDDVNDGMEFDHFIEIKHNNGEIEVTVGDNVHPMGENHRIAWVGLYDEYGDFVEEKFLGLDEDPCVIFDDNGLDIFEIRIKCSQHKIFAKKFEL